MTAGNMALMFAPNVFRKRKGEEEESTLATVGLISMNVSNMVTMLDKYEEIFAQRIKSLEDLSSSDYDVDDGVDAKINVPNVQKVNMTLDH
jgi:hypothetical protein